MKNLQKAAAGGAAATLPTKTKQSRKMSEIQFNLCGRKQRFEAEYTISTHMDCSRRSWRHSRFHFMQFRFKRSRHIAEKC